MDLFRKIRKMIENMDKLSEDEAALLCFYSIECFVTSKDFLIKMGENDLADGLSRIIYKLTHEVLVEVKD